MNNPRTFTWLSSIFFVIAVVLMLTKQQSLGTTFIALGAVFLALGQLPPKDRGNASPEDEQNPRDEEPPRPSA